MHKIYGFNNGGSPGWYQAMAMGDDGYVVGEHICSHDCFMPHDLGMDGRSNWKHDQYNKHYGVGNWETEFVEREQVPTHEGLQAALKVAKELQDNIVCERAGATVEFSDGTEIKVGA